MGTKRAVWSRGIGFWRTRRVTLPQKRDESLPIIFELRKVSGSTFSLIPDHLLGIEGRVDHVHMDAQGTVKQLIQRAVLQPTSNSTLSSHRRLK